MAVRTSTNRLAVARVVSLVLGLVGFGSAGLGCLLDTFTVGRLGIDVSRRLDDVSSGSQSLLLASCLVGAVALLLAQSPFARWMAVLTLAGGGYAIALMLDAWHEIGGDAPGAKGIVNAVLNPRPAAGFYVTVAGAGVAVIAGLMTLVTRREGSMLVVHEPRMTHPGNAPRAAVSSAPRSARRDRRGAIPHPDRRPGWHPDPGGSGRLRWWDGRRWAPEPMSGESLAPPTGY